MKRLVKKYAKYNGEREEIEITFPQIKRKKFCVDEEGNIIPLTTEKVKKVKFIGLKKCLKVMFQKYRVVLEKRKIGAGGRRYTTFPHGFREAEEEGGGEGGSASESENYGDDDDDAAANLPRNATPLPSLDAPLSLTSPQKPIEFISLSPSPPPSHSPLPPPDHDISYDADFSDNDN